MNIFKQLVVSLYSPKDIASFRLQKIGKTILFLSILSFIAIIPVSYYTNAAINHGLEITKSTLQNNVPEFEIKNGVLTSDANEPVTIESNDFTVIIDSTGTVTKEDIFKEENTFALLKNEFALSIEGTKDDIQYSVLEGFHITKTDVEDIVSSFDESKSTIIPIFLIFIYIFTLVSHFIKVTIIAIIGLLFKNVLQKQLTYGQIWRLSAYSITLPTLFFTIMGLLNTQVPYEFLINWAVTLVMLYLSMKESESNEIPNYKEY